MGEGGNPQFRTFAEHFPSIFGGTTTRGRCGGGDAQQFRKFPEHFPNIFGGTTTPGEVWGGGTYQFRTFRKDILDIFWDRPSFLRGGQRFAGNATSIGGGGNGGQCRMHVRTGCLQIRGTLLLSGCVRESWLGEIFFPTVNPPRDVAAKRAASRQAVSMTTKSATRARQKMAEPLCQGGLRIGGTVSHVRPTICSKCDVGRRGAKRARKTAP